MASGQSGAPIALPQGGGAISGVGEKFGADPHTGTGTFTVPLTVPPGRHGLGPDLTLRYSTGAGNGPFGLGWSLSVAGVSRRVAKGVPRYDDSDVFVLSDGEDLVPVETSGTVTRYQPRTEGPSARILHHVGQNANYWRVTGRDGMVSTYGDPAGAAATAADPADPGRVFAWRITRTEDPLGNHIGYDHLRDSGTEGRHRWDQLYLRRIRYIDYGPEPKYLVSVTFEYEDRPDAHSDRRAGFEIRTRLRCARIVVRTHADVDRVVRTYDLGYGPEPLNGVSLLSRVQVTGHDGDRTERLPPLTFQYSDFAPARRTFRAVAGPDIPSLAAPGVALVDLDGNALPDLVELTGDARHWRNLGDGRFDVPRRLPASLAGARLTDPGVRIVDADGDGRADLLVSRGTLSGHVPLRSRRDADVHAASARRDADVHAASARRDAFRRFGTAPSFDLDDPRVRLVDLDGDGVTDAVRSGSRLECFFAHPVQGWHRTRAVARRSLDAFPDVSFADPRIRFADMTGDGLPDVVFVRAGSVEYWPSLGHGDFGPRTVMRQAPRLPVGTDPGRVLLGDVDGDGLADLVHVGPDTVTVWINRGGRGWSEPVEIRARAGAAERQVRGTPAVTGGDLRLVDLLGTGVAGVLWSGPAHGWHFLDLTGGRKPYLLEEIDNHIGATTRVGYAPSSRYYVEDERHRATRWRTSLPFPVHVVDRITVHDRYSGGTLTTRYRYRHGHWDGAEREFRGFARVEQLDAEVVDGRAAPPVLTRTWFHPGPVGPAEGDWVDPDFTDEYWPGQPPTWPACELPADPPTPDGRGARREAVRALRGSVLRTEVYALDGSSRADRPYVVSEKTFAVADVVARRVHRPYAIAARETQWERGDDPMTRFTFTSYRDPTGDLDPYGRVLAQTAIACPRGWRRMADRPAEPYLATVTRTEYAVADQVATHIHDRTAATTTFEITDTAGRTVTELVASPALRLNGQTVHYYDGPAFVGLPRGRLGAHGLGVRTETLVLTDDLLTSAYGAEQPAYLLSDAPSWDPAVPIGFRTQLAPRAGYVHRAAGADPLREPAGWFAPSEQRAYDVQLGPAGRGLIREVREPLWHAGDPAGHRTRLEHDPYDLAVRQVIDSADLATVTEYDYRLLRPQAVTDPNGARSLVSYSPLGLVTAVAVRGRTPAEGDSAEPSTRFEYDLGAQPIRVRTIRRVHHDTDLGVPAVDRDQTLHTVEYTDGFGRLLQVRTQGDDVRFTEAAFDGADVTAVVVADGPAVTVSGWRVYDNKGRVIEAYEPFFATGWDYAAPGEAERGRKVVTGYDPLGRPHRTVRPDGGQTLVVRGVPVALDRPDEYAPTPWEAYTYDPDDNAGRTHPDDDTARHHRDTPASARTDALGRVVEAVVRLRNAPAAPGDLPGAVREIGTVTSYDIRDNPLRVVDPLGRTAFSSHYDLANRPIRTVAVDSGSHAMVWDAAGNPVENRDGRGAVVLHGYDSLGRPDRTWAREAADAPITLVERIEYGDGGSAAQPATDRAQARAAYRLGRPYRQFDGAGELTADRYHFTGALAARTRRVVADSALLGPQPFRPDWTNPAGTPFDPTGFTTTTRYDACGRITRTVLPADVDGVRRALVPRYDRAGALAGMASEVPGAADPQVHVRRIAYDAQGRRVLVAYGSGIMTRYGYHPDTLRLRRMRSERFTTPDPLTYRPAGQVVQDLAYAYDIAGNPTRIADRTPSCGVPNTPLGRDALDRTFEYDSLHRLTRATGRECDVPLPVPWDPGPRCVDVNRARGYVQTYRYDDLGGLRELKHLAGGAGTARGYAIGAGSNRLATLTVGPVTTDFGYDANGNLLAEGTSRHFGWDHANRLSTYRNQAGAGPASQSAEYLYDAAGQRVKKVVRSGAKVTSVVYLDGVLERIRVAGVGVPVENDTVHVMDGRSRIATIRVGPPLPGDTTPAVQFHLADHLGNSSVVLDGVGAPVAREEYTPYGETSFGGHAFKRYRHGGKERDEESGLAYFGFRYFVAWLGRWASPDPAGPVDGVNLYRAFAGNPLRMRDPDGRQSADSSGGLPSSSGNATLEKSAESSAGGTATVTAPAVTAPASAAAPSITPQDLPDAAPDPPKPSSAKPTDLRQACPTCGGPPRENSQADDVAQAVQNHILLGLSLAPASLAMRVTGLDRALNDALVAIGGSTAPDALFFSGMAEFAGGSVAVRMPRASTISERPGAPIGAAPPPPSPAPTSPPTSPPGANFWGSHSTRPEPPRTRGTPSGYSVYHEVQLKPAKDARDLGSRTEHRHRSNKALAEAMDADASLRAVLEAAGVTRPVANKFGRYLRNPSGFVWHHVPARPGVMHLVEATEHTSGTNAYFWMHDWGFGGMNEWGHAF